MFKKIIRTGITVLLSSTIAIGSNSFCIHADSNRNDHISSTYEAKEAIENNNYVAMLNYVSLINSEINKSSNSKLVLEEIYSSLMNNTAPSAIDSRTQVQLTDMLETIDNYRMIDVKRERLQYIYDQNKAQALRNAVPNPLGLLSATRSFSLASLIGSVVYMAVDAKTSYDSAMASAELEYLQDNWALDDEATKALNHSQEALFNYMIDMVHKSNMPDEYALSNTKIDEFVDYRNKTNVDRKIQYFESNKRTFEKFGPYWLSLAECYFQIEEYAKCLTAVKEYESLNYRIFRKDHEFSRIIPLAIVSIQEVEKDKEEANEQILHYLSALISNLETKDWSLRYFAAQTYLDLYSTTKDKSFLDAAYKLTKDNVNYLIDQQTTLNTTYLSKIQKKPVPKDATKTEKKDIEKYNKMLEAERKKELPPVNEALYLNCDLLFALADRVNISEQEKDQIERILHGRKKEDPLFLTTPLDELYYFDEIEAVSDYDVEYSEDSITLPANLLSNNFQINVLIENDNEKKEVTDWTVEKVDRGKETSNVESFRVRLLSESIKNYKYEDGTLINIEIIPVIGGQCEPLEAKFITHVKPKLKVFKDITFERTK